MKITLWLVSYNAMGSHPVVSLAGNLLIGSGTRLGKAANQIEIYAHLASGGRPIRGLGFMMKRFRENLATLPKVWFRRSQSRIDIAYPSYLGTPEALLDDECQIRKRIDLSLLRKASVEITGALQLVKKCIKPSDDCSVDRFLASIAARHAELNGLSDRQLRRVLKAAAEKDARKTAVAGGLR